MATKIRLQRHGRKKKSFFHIVVADSRAPRDGRFIEKLGSYNPLTNPATIELNLDKTVEWLMTGAEPTDTAAAILSYKGAAFKKHLITGVNKGAITQEQADAKFAEWQTMKTEQVEKKKAGLADSKTQKKTEAMKAETARKEAIAAKVLIKNTPVEEVAEEEVAVDAQDETGVAEVSEMENIGETETAAETEVEAPSEEAPATEEVTEEAPAAEEEVSAPEEEVSAPEEEVPATEPEIEAPVAEAETAEEVPAEEIAAEEPETEEAPAAEDAPTEEGDAASEEEKPAE